MSAQVVQTVDAEIAGLADEYVRGGVRALVEGDAGTEAKRRAA